MDCKTLLLGIGSAGFSLRQGDLGREDPPEGRLRRASPLGQASRDSHRGRQAAGKGAGGDWYSADAGVTTGFRSSPASTGEPATNSSPASGDVVPPSEPASEAAPPGSIALDAALAILYPSRNPSDLRQHAQSLVGDAVVDLRGLRQILATFDRQFYPSPVSIRFGPDDVVTHELDNDLTLFPRP